MASNVTGVFVWECADRVCVMKLQALGFSKHAGGTSGFLAALQQVDLYDNQQT